MGCVNMAAITEPFGRAFHSVKVAMGDKNALLSEALAGVEKLRDELAALVSTTETANEEADRLALASPHNIDQIQPMLAATRRGWIGSPNDRALEQLFRENPEWRSTLKRACEARLRTEEEASKKIEEAARADLNGFSNDEIEQHPRLRRARRTVERWQAICHACVNETHDAVLWKSVTRNLFA